MEETFSLMGIEGFVMDCDSSGLFPCSSTDGKGVLFSDCVVASLRSHDSSSNGRSKWGVKIILDGIFAAQNEKSRVDSYTFAPSPSAYASKEDCCE